MAVRRVLRASTLGLYFSRHEGIGGFLRGVLLKVEPRGGDRTRRVHPTASEETVRDESVGRHALASSS